MTQATINLPAQQALLHHNALHSLCDDEGNTARILSITPSSADPQDHEWITIETPFGQKRLAPSTLVTVTLREGEDPTDYIVPVHQCTLCDTPIQTDQLWLSLSEYGLYIHLDCVRRANALTILGHITDEACINDDWDRRVRRPAQLQDPNADVEYG